MVHQSRLIAVIEDEPTSAEALAMVLRDWGAEVAVGAHANDIADQLGPRLAEVGWIITDFNPSDGRTGTVDTIIAVATRARVLVLSGDLNRHATTVAAEVGFEVMDKPARPDKIVAWLERA